jgi:LysR family hydrogen peroxide-inducible transcriptional activator
MRLKQVEYFLVLCHELSFTRAAKCCRVSQPSLTIAIKSLEAELGGELFWRKPTIRLSELGHTVRPHLQRVLEGVQGARRAANHHRFVRTAPTNEDRAIRL